MSKRVAPMSALQLQALQAATEAAEAKAEAAELKRQLAEAKAASEGGGSASASSNASMGSASSSNFSASAGGSSNSPAAAAAEGGAGSSAKKMRKLEMVVIDLSKSGTLQAFTGPKKAILSYTNPVTPAHLTHLYQFMHDNEVPGAYQVDSEKTWGLIRKNPVIRFTYTTAGYKLPMDADITYSGKTVMIPIEVLLILDELDLMDKFRTYFLTDATYGAHSYRFYDKVGAPQFIGSSGGGGGGGGGASAGGGNSSASGGQGGGYRRRGSRKSGRKSRKSKHRSSKRRSSRKGRKTRK